MSCPRCGSSDHNVSRCPWNLMTQELDDLYAAAQARCDAGEQAARRIDLAYRVPPGDGEMGVLPWLTEAESDRIRVLKRELLRLDSPQAAWDRLAAKHARRAQIRAISMHVALDMRRVST